MIAIIKRNLPLIAILVLGLALRIYCIGSESFWLDEGGSIRGASKPVVKLVAEVAADVHPPFYYLLLRSWIIAFGSSESSARALSALFGVLTILAAFKVGAALFSRRAGHIAALIVAVSPYLIYYSQEARCYALLGLLTTASVWLALEIFSGKRLAAELGLLLVNVIMLYTHVYGILFFALVNLIYFALLLFSKSESLPGPARWIAFQAIAAALFLPWTMVLADQVQRVHEGFWIPAPHPWIIRKTFMAFAGHKALYYIFLALAILGVISFKRVRGELRGRDIVGSLEEISFETKARAPAAALVLIAWILFPILAPLAYSKLAVPIYHIKYVIGSAIPFYILIAAGADSITSNKTRAVLIAIIIAFSSASLHGYYRDVDKEQWREAVAELEARAGIGETVIVVPGECVQQIYNYYSKRVDLETAWLPNEKNDPPKIIGPQRLAENVRQKNSFWIVRRARKRVAKIDVRAFNRAGFQLEFHNALFKIEIFHFVKSP